MEHIADSEWSGNVVRAGLQKGEVLCCEDHMGVWDVPSTHHEIRMLDGNVLWSLVDEIITETI